MEKIGVILTLLWTVLVAVIINSKWDDAISMKLNEWGDFLAGITAPLAFLWLIIGYMLQRKELSANTEALKFQRDEMAKQANELAEQNKHLAATAKATQQQAQQSILRR